MSTLYEKYNTGDNDSTGILNVNWCCQTFTAESDHTITSVKILAYRIGTVSTLTAHIRATSSNVPTGEDVTSGTLDVSGLTTNTAGAWIEVPIASFNLANGVKYAIIFSINDGTNQVRFRENWPDGGYAGGGQVYSGDSGATWGAASAVDVLFEVWGEEITAPSIKGAALLLA